MDFSNEVDHKYISLRRINYVIFCFKASRLLRLGKFSKFARWRVINDKISSIIQREAYLSNLNFYSLYKLIQQSLHLTKWQLVALQTSYF